MFKPYKEKIDDVFNYYNSSEFGLTNTQVISNQEKYGKNSLGKKHKTSKIILFLEQFNSPLIYVLLIAILISIYMKDIIEAIVILSIVIINAIIGFMQEEKSDKAIELLEKKATPEVKVKRNGKVIFVKIEELVPGDVVLLEAGNIIPTDGRIISSTDLIIDESSLTGESKDVEKINSIVNSDEVYEQKNMLFKNTLVKQGFANYIVTNIGLNTKVGEITKLMKSAKTKNNFQKEINVLSKNITVAILLITIIVFFIVLKTNSIDYALLFALSLAVGAIPEGLLATITISLAIGAKKLAKKNIIIKKLDSIETLGEIDTIITDKTGTLTKNQMSLKYFIDAKNNFLKKIGSFNYYLFEALICNEARFVDEKISGNSFDKAFLKYIKDFRLFDLLDKRKSIIVKKIFYFNSDRKYQSIIYECNKKFYFVSKGSYENLYKLNKKISNEHIRLMDHSLNNGFISLCLFKKELTSQEIKEIDNLKESHLIRESDFLGTFFLYDEPRDGVDNVIKECQDSGISIIMATGDSLNTAKNIGSEIGINGFAKEGKFLSDINFENLTKDEDKDLEKTNIFARVEPKHKYQLVDYYQRKGHLVAMTGDGINDSPALKKSNVGIAIGNGTDIAKESSKLIITDSNFKNIVLALKEGKTIFYNIKKIISFLISTNFTQVFVILFSLISNLGLPFRALHLLWINLVTETIPAIPMSVDNSPKNILSFKSHGLVDKKLKKEILRSVIAMSVSISILLFFSSRLNLSFQTIAVTSIVLMKVAKIMKMRQREKLKIFSNKFLTYAVLGSILIQIIAIYSPLNQILFFTPLVGIEWLMIMGSVLFAYILL